MIRLVIALIAIGCVVAYKGYEEYAVSSSASEQPVTCDLAALEKGGALSDNHVQFGKHSAVYGGAIFEYQESKTASAGGQPPDSATVNYAYYPIISPEHPFNKKWEELTASYESVEMIPEGELPNLEDFVVIVKTKRFHTVGSIPDDVQDHEAVKGLVVNRIEKLDAEEERLLKQGFPKVDVSKLILVEENRTPASTGTPFAMMGGGAFLAVIGLGLLVVPMMKGKA